MTDADADETVLIALDNSEQSDFAVQWYLDKIHRPGHKLVFVHTVELPEMRIDEASQYTSTFSSHKPRQFHMSPGVLASMWKDEEGKTKELEYRIKTLLKGKGLTGVLRTAQGKAGEIVCRIATEENATMIITGTRGMTKFKRTFVGSVSDYLTHHAPCPTVVCPLPGTNSRRSSFARSFSFGEKNNRQRHVSGDPNQMQEKRTRHFSGLKFKARSKSVSSDIEL